MIIKNAFFFFILFSLSSSSQKKKNIFLKLLHPNKIGFLYNKAQDNNFLFDDEDYFYSTNTFKLQSFYNLGNYKQFSFNLIIEPQIQIVKHQLLNEQFVVPTEENYLHKRIEFKALKTMYLHALELGFAVKKKVSQKLELQVTIGLGVATISKRTERLAKGFTFIENGSLGFIYKTTKKSFLYLGSNIGHVSNLNLKKPNSGYNIVGIDVGVRYLLK